MIVVLREEREQGLAIAAVGINQPWQGHVHARRRAGEKSVEAAALIADLLAVPNDWVSGVYVVQVRSDRGVGYLSFVVRDLAIGPCANHVFFLGKLAYITSGGPTPCAPAGAATRQGKVVILDRITHSVVRELSGPAFTGDPHGIWATGDGSRLFVGRESANQVSVIDTGKPNDPADDRVIATVDVGKQPIDVVVSSHPSVVGP